MSGPLTDEALVRLEVACAQCQPQGPWDDFLGERADVASARYVLGHADRSIAAALAELREARSLFASLPADLARTPLEVMRKLHELLAELRALRAERAQLAARVELAEREWRAALDRAELAQREWVAALDRVDRAIDSAQEGWSRVEQSERERLAMVEALGELAPGVTPVAAIESLVAQHGQQLADERRQSWRPAPADLDAENQAATAARCRLWVAIPDPKFKVSVMSYQMWLYRVRPGVPYAVRWQPREPAPPAPPSDVCS